MNTVAIPYIGAQFGGGSGQPIWLDNVQCSGRESRLLDCDFSVIGHHNCVHAEDAGVKCQPLNSGK